MKKPAAAKKPAAKTTLHASLSMKTVQKKAAPKKKPVAKKPAAGRKSAAPAGKAPVTAHQAHLAHLAHLARLGLRPKPAAKHQRRMLALGEGVACCAAEAVAASLRLTGRPVSDADVLALYGRTADDPDTGAMILATLEAAAEYGLAGYRPVFGEVMPDELLSAALPLVSRAGQTSWPGSPALDALTCNYENPITYSRRSGDWPRSLILGLELPGPHAVLDDGLAWWSWGEPYDVAAFPGAVIGEAWTLTWD